MKDKELRSKLDELGIVKEDYITGKLKDVDFMEYLELKRKVDLILDYLGVSVSQGMKLEKRRIIGNSSRQTKKSN